MIDVSVDHVSKRYTIEAPLGHMDHRAGWWRLHRHFPKRNEVWALKNVSFEVQHSEALGIVGHNGAGKSTMLKLLSSITAPTNGEIRIRGSLSALVEVSSGFHSELSGRENIFLNGSILGMTRKEIARKLESIIDFAGIRPYIDVPVKRYSSGMFVRLGFSIAAHLEPDILLLDEVLAVGDAAFQARCLDRIDQLRQHGTTIVLISHDLAALERLCNRALLLQDGQLLMTGRPRRVIEEYQRTACQTIVAAAEMDTASARCAELTQLRFEHPRGGPIRTGEPMVVRLSYRVHQIVENPVFSVSFYWPSGYLCAQLTSADKLQGMTLERGSGTVEFFCPILAMQRGLYRVDAAIEQHGEAIDHRQRHSLLRVDPGKIVLGDFYLEHSCRVICGAQSAESGRAVPAR